MYSPVFSFKYYQQEKEEFTKMFTTEFFSHKKLYELRYENKRSDRRLEIQDVLIRKKGICNSLAVIYKMLLEKAGIYSMCICMKGHIYGH